MHPRLLTVSFGLFLLRSWEQAPADPAAVLAPRSAPVAIARAATNDNRTPAGVLRRGVLRLRLEVRPATWFPEGEAGASTTVLSFGEVGRAPSVPGPLVRVRTGTTVDLELTNPLDRPLTVHGLHTRPSRGDSVVVPARGRHMLRFDAGAPGTYFYWASTSGASLGKRRADESQLHGAFVVDSAGAGRRPADRVFVLGSWFVPVDSAGPRPWVPRDMMVINGKSWPHTERFAFAVGDTVRWRWVNPTADAHPMHLHGFYYDVTSRGTWAADTMLRGDERRHVVTELMLPGGTMDTQWVPSAAGNWLFHCHFAFHVSHFLSLEKVPDLEHPGARDAVRHHADAMRGLVLGMTVRPRRGARATLRPPASAREIRVVARAAPARHGSAEGYVYTAGPEGGGARALPPLSDPLVLARGEPVRITVVNRLAAPTAVHWHGMELEDSYSDGVPGWSGLGNRLAPSIAPGDSFVAAFTPPRAGTFIYHAHSHEGHQISSGLFGALLVVDPSAPRDTSSERTFVIGRDGPVREGASVNGSSAPAAVGLRVGRPYRFRIVQIHPDARIVVSLMSSRGVEQWRRLAKDGADLAISQRRLRPARELLGPGETIDVEVAAESSRDLWLDVSAHTPGWSMRAPLRVEP